MAILIGILLALVIGLVMTWVGLDRDRAFYTTVTIVVATYYALFAVMGASTSALLRECVGVAAFGIGAIVGFKKNLWIVAGLLAGHGAFDFVHGHVISNPGMPAWWPTFCGAYDVTAGAYPAWRLRTSAISAKPQPN